MADESAPAPADGAAAPPPAAPPAPRPRHAPSPLPPFKLERFFARYEFDPAVRHCLCASDCEPLTLAELLAAADADSVARYHALSLAYTESAGLPALREAIAAMYGTLEARHVVVGAPQELVSLAMAALLAPGDHVVCCFPGYQSLYQLAQSAGCEVSLWEPRPGEGGALRFDVADLQAALRPDTKLVVTNCPHNPTGWLPSLAEWDAILAACRAAGAALFSDEMYRGLELDPRRRLPAAADAAGVRAASLCGVSKAVGLPGLRIGWLATKDEALLARVVELKDYSTICSAAPSEILGLAAVRAWSALVGSRLAIVRANLDALARFFDRWGGAVAWAAPAAGTVCFPRLLTGEPVEAFCEELARADGVLLMPATVYDHAPSVAEGRFRLGYGRRDLPACLQALEAALLRRGLRPRAGGPSHSVS
jgi:aspartate/methionine/tyrosine aminotransferase